MPDESAMFSVLFILSSCHADLEVGDTAGLEIRATCHPYFFWNSRFHPANETLVFNRT